MFKDDTLVETSLVAVVLFAVVLHPIAKIAANITTRTKVFIVAPFFRWKAFVPEVEQVVDQFCVKILVAKNTEDLEV